jgi:hypothetical protein
MVVHTFIAMKTASAHTCAPEIPATGANTTTPLLGIRALLPFSMAARPLPENPSPTILLHKTAAGPSFSRPGETTLPWS